MEKMELLEALNGLIARHEQHRHYIDKAKAQAATGRFNNAVIERVILDHEIKSSDVADKVAPLLPELRNLVTGLESERTRINVAKGGVDEQVQEYELRLAIGELTDEQFENEVRELRENLSQSNQRIAAIEADLDELNGALARWAATAGPAGHYAPPEAPAPVAEPLAPVVEAAVVDSTPIVDDEPQPEVADHDGSHASRSDLVEDLSPVFTAGVSAGASVRIPGADEEIAIETSEVSEDAGDAAADVAFGFDDDNAAEVEIDLAADAAASPAAPPARAAEPEPAAEAPRRALLLYQEGTAEEQIYPFTGDILTIGRGRENDIQIKNDSKVSRYHCKIFRRGNNFYIEDQKSSNGSLVNGELITDRRLFGGEEIVIGETFFRFRILE
jgi:hypothetical protein